MKVGVVKEIKADEYRVALTPAGARELVERGHDVLVEAGAGDGSTILEAFKPGTSPPDTFTVLGGGGGGAGVSAESDRAVGAGTGGLY